jgi:hypothetical protein
MFVQLPKPYDDELLHSVVARFLSYRGGTTIPELFEPTFKSRPDLPRRLNAIAEATQLTWAMNGEDIANRLTLFPYLTCYASDASKLKCLEAILQDSNSTTCNNSNISKRSNNGLYYNQSRLGAASWFRFCSECRKEDLRDFGETFWRRSHQLDGVLVCTKHEILLSNSSCHRGIRSCGRFHCDPLEFTTDISNVPQLSFCSKEIDKLLLVAHRAQAMLNGPPKRWPRLDILDQYRTSAVAMGFSKRYENANLQLIADDIQDYYGNKVIS